MNPFADDFEPLVPAPSENDGRRSFSLVLERYYSRNEPHVVVPFGTTQILPEAFRGHDEIETIELPETLESIGAAAFRECSGLREVVVPGSVFEIGDRAFSGCASLRKVTLPQALMGVGRSVFSRCSSLEALRGGDEVYEVGASAFSGCTSLRDLPQFPRLESIGAEAFAGCGSLKRAVLPRTVRSVGTEAFRSCLGLVSAYIPESADDLGRNLFSGCVNLGVIEGVDALVDRFPDAFPRGLSASRGYVRSQDRSEQIRAYRRVHEDDIDALKGKIAASREKTGRISREIEDAGLFERARRKELAESLARERGTLRDLNERLKALENPSDEELLRMMRES